MPVLTPVDFLAMTRPGGGDTWDLSMHRGLASGLGTLWGGCGLAASIEAMETLSGRPCIWATVQYIRPILVDTTLNLTVELDREGRGITQARVVGRVAGTVVLTGLGSFGMHGGGEWQSVHAPADLPPPENGLKRAMPLPIDLSATLIGRLEQRWAQTPPTFTDDGTPGTGRQRVWARLSDPVETTRSMLAVLADLAPSAVAEAIGHTVAGVSLDNTIRFAGHPPAGPHAWIFMEISVEAVVGDVAQLSARMFDETGRLIAVAGQSAMVRRIPARAGWIQRSHQE